MRFTAALYLTLHAAVALAQSSTSKFVAASGTDFVQDGKPFRFIGTNAPWLATLNSDEDLESVLRNMSAKGISVVRTWAFNDVEEIPVNGTWLQLIANGTTTVNTGPTGLGRLDRIVELAEKYNIRVLFSLTNNWNPGSTDGVANGEVSPETTKPLPRNFLSNNYGGMDAYVRAFGLAKTHDEFYTDQTIIDNFKNYTTQIVSRYVNSSGLLGYELANDPRCNSTIAASNNCNPQTLTKWHATLSKHVRIIDPNHLVSSGNHGFLCVDCPKLYPKVTSTSPPTPSPAVQLVRRKAPRALTRKRILSERAQNWRRSRHMQTRAEKLAKRSGPSIRGAWAPPPTRTRNLDVLGEAYDGSHGVDSEDIFNIEDIGFASFQFFPDQQQYQPADPSLDKFNNTVAEGLEWIARWAEIGALFEKPVSLTGFGLVTNDNAPWFVPFNETIAPYTADDISAIGNDEQQPFVTDSQQKDAYTQWITQGLGLGLNGMIHYQWGQGNLTSSPGTTISPDVNSNTQSANEESNTSSPNDGYSISSMSDDDVSSIFSDSAQSILSDAPIAA